MEKEARNMVGQWNQMELLKWDKKQSWISKSSQQKWRVPLTCLRWRKKTRRQPWKNRKTSSTEKWCQEWPMTTQKHHKQVNKGIYSGGIEQDRILFKLTENWGKLTLREYIGREKEKVSEEKMEFKHLYLYK